MPDWLWWTLAVYLGIGVGLLVVIERAEGQSVGWWARLLIVLGWLPGFLTGTLMEVGDG